MAGDGRKPGNGEDGALEHDNVVRFPRNWIGSLDDLVPIGQAGTAGARTDQIQERVGGRTPGATAEPTVAAAAAAEGAVAGETGAAEPGAGDPVTPADVVAADDFWGEQAEAFHQPFAADGGSFAASGDERPTDVDDRPKAGRGLGLRASVVALMLVAVTLVAAMVIALGGGTSGGGAGAGLNRIPLTASRTGGGATAASHRRPPTKRHQRARDGTVRSRHRAAPARRSARPTGRTDVVDSPTRTTVSNTSTSAPVVQSGSGSQTASTGSDQGGSVGSSSAGSGGPMAAGGLPGPDAVSPAAP